MLVLFSLTFIYFFILLQTFYRKCTIGTLFTRLYCEALIYFICNAVFVLHLCSDDFVLLYFACDSVCAVCDVRTTSLVLSCSLFFLCVRCLTPVFCCDVVELGTYGKLKYYHSMTEEGKPETFHYFHRLVWLLTSFLFSIFPSPSQINTFVRPSSLVSSRS